MAAPYKASMCLATNNNFVLPGAASNDFIVYVGNSNQSTLFGVSNLRTLMRVDGIGNVSFSGNVGFSNQVSLSGIQLTQRTSTTTNNVTSAVTSVNGFTSSAGNINIYMDNGSNYIAFSRSNVELARMNSNGWLGLGTTTPRSTLDVNGTFTLSNGYVKVYGSNIYTEIIRANASSDTAGYWVAGSFGDSTTTNARVVAGTLSGRPTIAAYNNTMTAWGGPLYLGGNPVGTVATEACHIFPSDADAINLGSNNQRWKTVYTNNLQTDNLSSLANKLTVYSSVNPNAHNTLDFGSNTTSWRNAYFAGDVRSYTVSANTIYGTSSNAGWIAGAFGSNSGERLVMGTLNGKPTLGTRTNDLGAYGSYNIYFESSIHPTNHASYDLGTAAVKWRNAYLSGSINAIGATIGGDFYFGIPGISTNFIGPSTGMVIDFGTSTNRWNSGYFSANVYGPNALTSDSNAKNIEPLPYGLEHISAITPIMYTWKEGHAYVDKRKHYGVVAQELQNILPEMVYTAPDGLLAINYDELIPVCIASIKELKSQNEDLRARIEALETAKLLT